MPQVAFRVQPEETKNFASVYKVHGIYIPFGPEHIQFATDWANIVLNNFIEQCQQMIGMAMPAAPEAQVMPAPVQGQPPELPVADLMQAQ